MKCQRSSGCALGLGLELLGAVLAHDRQAGLGDHAELLERDVLHRGEQLDLGRVAAGLLRRRGDLLADALGRGAHRLGLQAGDQARHTTPAWRPVTPRSRRWEKNSSGRRTSCTARRRGPLATPGGLELRPGDGGEVEVALADARVVGREARVDLLADLVAAAARRRAERGGDGPVRPELAQRRDALGHDPARQPAPAAVQRRDGAVGDEHHRQAVGREHERGDVVERRRLAVLLGRGPLGPGRLGRRGARSRRGPAARRGSARGAAGRSGEALAVGVDVGVAVVGEPAEVERGERTLGDAAAAGGEQDRAAGEVGGDVVAVAAEGGGQRPIGPSCTRSRRAVRRSVAADAAAPRSALAALRRQRDRSCASRSRASPSSAPPWRRRAPPDRRARQPAATRSSPSIASRTPRTSSSHLRAASRRPERAGQRDRLGRLAPQQRPQPRRAVHPAHHRRERAGAGGRGDDDVALAGGELQPVEALGELGGARVEAAGGQRDEVGARVVRASGFCARSTRSGSTRKPGSSARADPQPLQAAHRGRLGLAQQQPQLGAEPRAGDGRRARRRRPPRTPTGASPARSGSRSRAP